MRKIHTGGILILCVAILSGCGTKRYIPRKSISTQEYIQTYKELAVEDMQQYKIPASIKLAQAILESGSGSSTLAIKAKNHFGIKCNNGWRGNFYRYDDDAPNECFRKYETVQQSYHDHSEFLFNGPRYSGLFEFDITDYKAWAKGLKKAGYATNPRYDHLLIDIIERYDLDRYDEMMLREIRKEEDVADNSSESELIAEQNITENTMDSSLFKFLEYGPDGRKVYLNNNTRLIFARKDDSFLKIAKDFEIYAYQVYKYNDLNKHSTIHKGQIIYLEKKRNRASEKYHKVETGETMHFIAQRHGIKLEKLYKKNRMKPGSQPHAGDTILLR